MRNHDKAARATRALMAGVVGIWVAAGVLVWALVPRLVVEPALAADANVIVSALGAFALLLAAVGTLALLSLGVVWLWPRLAVGRVLLLTSGVVTTIAGLLLLNFGTLEAPPEFRWSAGAAFAGAAVVAILVGVGLLMCAAALFGDLPGAPIAERMMVDAELDMAAPRRELMLVLTAALVLAWIVAMATLLRTHTAQAFDVMQFLMPILAGALAGVWRAGKPNRLASLGTAAAAGAASSCLFLAAMILGEYYRFDPLGYLVWWGLTGAVFGAVGYGVWLVGRRPRHWRARSAHAH